MTLVFPLTCSAGFCYGKNVAPSCRCFVQGESPNTDCETPGEETPGNSDTPGNKAPLSSSFQQRKAFFFLHVPPNHINVYVEEEQVEHGKAPHERVWCSHTLLLGPKRPPSCLGFPLISEQRAFPCPSEC